MEDQRGQFTFYRSFWEAIKCIPESDKLPVLEAMICCGLDGVEPDGLTPIQNAIYQLIRPVLLNGRKKSANAKQKGSKPEAKISKQEANKKQTVSKTKANKKQTVALPSIEKEKENEKENENDIEREIEKDSYKGRDLSFSDFNSFWEAYPKKVGKADAQKAWQKVKGVTLDVILQAIEQQKQSRQWQDKQYIPNPSTWLNQARWMDELPSASSAPYSSKDIPKGASGTLGEAEMEAIRQAMAQPAYDFSEEDEAWLRSL